MAMVISGLLFLVWFRPRRAQVSGTSMVPTLLPGDRLLLRRLTRRDIAVGQIVAVRDPRLSTRVLIKRIERVERGPRVLVFVAGDNPAASTDSRLFGGVDSADILGVALFRYGPKGRVGFLSQEGPGDVFELIGR